MVKKNIKTSNKDNELYILPSPNDEMREFINKFKVDMMEHVVSSIKFAVENKLPIVEVFQFKNSPFVVTIKAAEFVPNLEHISKFYKDHEIFELCPRVEQLRNILKNKPDEKEKPDSSEPDRPNS
jgi:hypothetical protein